MISDTEYKTATGVETPELDVTKLFLERADQQCTYHHTKGMVVVDRPPGNRKDEEKFLRTCLETIQDGTDYVDMNNIIHNVVSTPSKLSRLIQSADLVIGASMSYISGEDNYSPRIFEEIKPMLHCNQSNSRIGGYGLKLHPTYRYLNLYHWTVGDKRYGRMGKVFSLPKKTYDYSESPMEV